MYITSTFIKCPDPVNYDVCHILNKQAERRSCCGLNDDEDPLGGKSVSKLHDGLLILVYDITTCFSWSRELE